MSDSRRAILKILGALPFTGTTATKALVKQLGMPGVSAALTATAAALDKPAGEGEDRRSLSERTFGRAVGRHLGRLANRAREEHSSSFAFKQNGLDPDIATLKSCSYTYKAAKQRQRDHEQIEFFQTVQEQVWG